MNQEQINIGKITLPQCALLDPMFLGAPAHPHANIHFAADNEASKIMRLYAPQKELDALENILLGCLPILTSRHHIKLTVEWLMLLRYPTARSRISKKQQRLNEIIKDYAKAIADDHAPAALAVKSTLHQLTQHNRRLLAELPQRENHTGGTILRNAYALLYQQFAIDTPLHIMREIAPLLGVNIHDGQIDKHLSPNTRQALRDQVDKDKQAAREAATAIAANIPIMIRQPESPQSNAERYQTARQILAQITEPEIANSLLYALDECMHDNGFIL